MDNIAVQGTLKEKSRIMVVDDNITNLTVAKKALESIYTVIPVSSAKKALDFLSKTIPSLILLDIDMPEMDGFQTIKIIKANEKTRDIPVIFLTAKDDHGSELEGLRLGAVDYITKPFSIPLLLQRIELHIELVTQKRELSNYNLNLSRMVNEQTEVISELQHAVIRTLAELVERRDGTTGGHIMRTQKYLNTLVYALSGSEYHKTELAHLDFELLSESAQLHDIGKIAISDNILQKPGRLSEEEFNEIKKHPSVGEEAIKSAMSMTRSKEFLSNAAVIAISHHEKWNGSGYPYGLSGENIPLSGRLMAIADVYDALVSERPYKPAFSHEEAIKIIVEESGAHFDPKLIEIFLKVSEEFNVISKS